MHPYKNLPATSFWEKSISHAPWQQLDLVGKPKFLLSGQDRIATAGSCFAQNITRHMRQNGLEPYVAEPAHPIQIAFRADVESYAQYSARYGNIYTPRQCLELFLQAVGEMPIIEDFVTEGGRWYDLMRPNIEKKGFLSLQEATADRQYHIGCVKKMFETASVFIFTLGLTESWFNVRSGHTYPVCPGTVRGEYRKDEHQFRNFKHSEIAADLHRLVTGLQRINPHLKIILTVSPVQLVATYTAQNVLLASSYSKSVLRAACGEIEADYENVQYFPAYEIVSHPASFGQYLNSDLRSVSERGVAHVMQHFFSAFFAGALQTKPPLEAPAKTDKAFESANAVDAECEEMFNALK